jgi:drug/metabolite transporter superfamily protein YnfA
VCHIALAELGNRPLIFNKLLFLRRNHMFKTKRNIVLALAICALLLPMTVSAKGQVTRPFKIHGNVTVVISLLDGSLVGTETGEATHIGRYSSEGEGSFTGIGNATGVLTAANGDALFWSEVVTPISEVAYRIERTFTGGTGRFENASGGFSFEVTPNVVVAFPKVTLTFSYNATGTITY